MKTDVAVIGAGIIGLSSAMQLCERFPELRVVVLEKEAAVGCHQTGHNSGVIHSGIYYKPGSLKAKMSVEGAAAMVDFCKLHDIPYEVCGKIIVATNEAEIEKLEELFRRGNLNGVPGIKKISFSELREISNPAVAESLDCMSLRLPSLITAKCVSNFGISLS